MKTVTFTKGEPGIHVGDKRTVPDKLADELVAKGIATSEPFPPSDVAPMVKRTVDTPRRPMLSLGRKHRG